MKGGSRNHQIKQRGSFVVNESRFAEERRCFGLKRISTVGHRIRMNCVQYSKPHTIVLFIKTRGDDMKHYEKLIELGCFSRDDLIAITGSDAAANSLIHDYLKKGFIERVRRDLYTVISIETKQPIPTRYQIASRLFDDACVSNHSAFEYYGYANQVFYEVYVTTQNRFQSFEYDGVTYHRIAPRYEASAELSGGVRVTGLERTVIDSIQRIYQENPKDTKKRN